MMPDDIRVVDLFEAVLERTYLYTLYGSYQEAISFLEGCYTGLTHHRTDEAIQSSSLGVDVQRYRTFASRLCRKYSLSGDKEVFRWINEQNELPFEAALTLYREFKQSEGVASVG